MRKNSLRIPTYLGLFGLILLLSLVNFITRRFIWGPKASVTLIPQEVEITNVTSTAFTVSWKTDKPTVGMVKIVSPEEKIFADSRDLTRQEAGEYYLHYVVVSGLSPAKDYYFWVGSNGRWYGSEGKEEEKKFRVKTAVTEAVMPLEAKLAYGKVIDQNNQPVAGALVYLKIPQVAPLSGLTSSSGYWVIPLAFAFNPSLTALANYQEDTTEEEIIVEGGALGRSRVVNFTRNNKPVPPIVLGQDSDFRHLNGVVSPTKSEKKEEKGQLPPLEREGEKEKEFKILNPEEGESVNTTRPEIFGTGPSGKKVEIIIESPVVFRGEVVVGEEGEWHWSPPENLTPGEHRLTVKLKGEDGQEKVYTRKFIVLAAEGEPAFTATASGQTASLTPTPTSIFSPTPTSTPTLTITASATATATLSPTLTSTTVTQIPQTGLPFSLTASLLTGIVVLVFGLSLLF